MVPPLTCDAVALMMEPAQKALLVVVSAIDTEGTRTELTVMVMPALVAKVWLAQGALDVKMQVITSPFERPALVKLWLLLPAFTPFTCHW